MIRKLKSDFSGRTEMYPYAAFAVTVIILFMSFAVGNAFPKEGTDVYRGFFSGVSADLNIISSLREASGRSSLNIVPSVRYILADRLDPLFLLSCLLPGRLPEYLLAVGTFLKYGLASCLMSIFIVKRIRVRVNYGVLLSVLYSLSTPALTGACSGSLLNMLFMAPAVCLAVDRHLRSRRLKDSILASAVTAAALILTGTSGLTSVLFLSFFAGIILSVAAGEKKASVFGGILRNTLTVFTGSLLAGVCLVPSLRSAAQYPDPGELFQNGKMTVKLFDLLAYATDGRSPDTAVNLKPVSAGVFVLMLVILLYVNSTVPLRLKITLSAVLLIFYVSNAYTPFRTILNIYGQSQIYLLSMNIAVSAVIVSAAAISLRNLHSMKPFSVTAAGFAVIVLLVISANSGNDMRSEVFSLYFSAAAAIFWIFAVRYGNDGGDISRVYATFAFLGILLNTSWCLSSSHIGTVTSDVMPSFPSGNILEQAGIFDEEDDDSYIVLTSDLQGPVQGISVPEQINSMSRAALCEDILIRDDVIEMYSMGFERTATDDYRIVEPGEHSEIIFRFCDVPSGSSCCLFSGFGGTTYITVMYSGYDDVTSEDGPFLYIFTPSEEDFDIRLAIHEPAREECGISLWLTDGSELMRLRDLRRTFNGGSEVIPDGEGPFALTGNISVVTSIPYSDDIVVRRGQRDAEIFDFNGSLAFTIYNCGPSDLEPVRISPRSDDIVRGIAVTLFALFSTVLVYMYNVIKEKTTVREEEAIEEA